MSKSSNLKYFAPKYYHLHCNIQLLQKFITFNNKLKRHKNYPTFLFSSFENSWLKSHICKTTTGSSFKVMLLNEHDRHYWANSTKPSKEAWIRSFANVFGSHNHHNKYSTKDVSFTCASCSSYFCCVSFFFLRFLMFCAAYIIKFLDTCTSSKRLL